MGKNRNGLKAAVTFPLPGGVVHPRLPSLEKNNVNYRVPRCEETRRRRRKRKEREEKGSAWKRIMGEGWIFFQGQTWRKFETDAAKFAGLLTG